MITHEEDEIHAFINAVDISNYPEIASSDPTFYDIDGNQSEFLTILKGHGVNTIRLRLWVNPINEHSSFEEVKLFSATLIAKGFKTWLTLHYSDTWADPGKQKTPSKWRDLDFTTLQDSVYSYTSKVVNELNPDYIQVGNEINSGILHPTGDIATSKSNFISLIKSGSQAIRDNTDHTKIILHFAGMEGAEWFFNQVNEIDYDIIGLSYYPIWHGKSLSDLQKTLAALSSIHDKEIVIAETAYPFTLNWNDWTNNIVGLEQHLILPEYPATPQGQQKFLNAIRDAIEEIDGGIGFCYWGAEVISWKGTQSTDASPWENQALFDFDNKALPVLNAFNNR